MATRNLLAIKKLPAFKAWLDANGIENRPTGAAYQVLLGDEVDIPDELIKENQP